MTVFDAVVGEYDRGRPSYPDALYDALGSLADVSVLEIGAGTGIATRQLLERGAKLIALDAGPAVLAHAKHRSPGLVAAIGDGARLPLADACVELICCAQAWHWLDPDTRTAEARRVLRAGGRIAAWWSHPRIDAAAWLGDYWTVVERVCDGAHRSQAATDWGPTLADGGHLKVIDVAEFDWMRDVTADEWITDQASHSYVVALPEPTRSALLAELRAVVMRAFPARRLRVPFVTRMWLATPR